MNLRDRPHRIRSGQSVDFMKVPKAAHQAGALYCSFQPSLNRAELNRMIDVFRWG